MFDELTDFYVQLKDFDARVAMLYTILYDYVNESTATKKMPAYAYPSQATLCVKLGITDTRTLRKYVRALEKYDLVRVLETYDPVEKRSHHKYFVRDPIADKAKFMEKFGRHLKTNMPLAQEYANQGKEEVPPEILEFLTRDE